MKKYLIESKEGFFKKMLNQESIDAVNSSNFSTRFKKPLYDSFCFSKIPATVSYLLTGDGKEAALPSNCYTFDGKVYDGVILLFLDAFGWRFFERYSATHPFLKRFVEKGVVSKITSQFPSTTAAHMTTVHTGLEVGSTGIYEWFQYEPMVNRMIAPLLFSYAGDPVATSLLSSVHKPREFFPFTTIYQKLHLKDVESYVVQDASISQSPYSLALSVGAHSMGYLKLEQGLQNLGELFHGDSHAKTYAFFYYASIDSAGHRKGVNSGAFEKTILHCLDLLEKELMPILASSDKKMALLVTADHGMVEVRPRATIYLNEQLPAILDWLKVDSDGNVLIPAGSCRDFFLHIKEECLEKAMSALSALLVGKAEVWRVEDLICNGFFGSEAVSERFSERVGNLVVLPYENEGVWWHEKHKFQQNFYGAHGGLSSAEMETIFLFLEPNL